MRGAEAGVACDRALEMPPRFGQPPRVQEEVAEPELHLGPRRGGALDRDVGVEPFDLEASDGQGSDDVGGEEALRRVHARPEGGGERAGGVDAGGDRGEEDLQIGRPRRAAAEEGPVGERPRLRVEDPALFALVVEGRGVVELQQARERQALLALEASQVIRGGAPHERFRVAGRPAGEHLGQSLREPQGLRAQGAIQEDVRVFVEEGLAGVPGIGAEAGRDVIAVGSGLEVALDLLGPAAIDGEEGSEGVLVTEGHDDGGRIDAARAASEDRRHDATEPLQGHGHAARALRRRHR